MDTKTLEPQATDQTAAPQAEPAPTPKYKPPRPPVGLMVQWFHYGHHTAGAQAALVVGSEGMGTIKVRIFKDDGTPGGWKRSVWHTSDPALVKKDHLARSSSGTWDYIPGTPRIDLNQPLFDPEVETAKLRAELETLREAIVALQPCADVAQDVQEKIRQLFREGKKPGEIAKILAGGWTHLKVNGVLRHLGEQ